MPQVFQVLKCYKCLVFQVHQTKKSNKFQCKMCGEKQSIKRHYGLGNGLECRKHVQKLNVIRGEMDEAINSSDDSHEHENVENPSETILNGIHQEKSSKWSDFIDTEDVIDTPNIKTDEMYLNDAELVLELPKKRQKTLGRFKKKRNILNASMNNSDSEETNNIISTELLTSTGIISPKSHNYNNIVKPIPSRDKRQSSCFELKEQNKMKDDCLQLNHKFNLVSESVCSSRDFQDIACNISASPVKAVKKKPTFVPPVLNKNSKWAKFAGDCEEDDEITNTNKDDDNEISNSCRFLNEKSGLDCLGSLLSQENSSKPQETIEKLDIKTSNTQTLFALCDDDEIDDFLSIK